MHDNWNDTTEQKGSYQDASIHFPSLRCRILSYGRCADRAADTCCPVSYDMRGRGPCTIEHKYVLIPAV